MTKPMEKAGSKKYLQLYDTDWIRPLRKGFRMACCDCALIHVIDFRTNNGKIEMRFRRDDRATSAARRPLKKKAVAALRPKLAAKQE